MGGNLSGLREAGHTDAVAHDGALVELQQSHIVSEEGEFRANQSRESIISGLFHRLPITLSSLSLKVSVNFISVPEGSVRGA